MICGENGLKDNFTLAGFRDMKNNRKENERDGSRFMRGHLDVDHVNLCIYFVFIGDIRCYQNDQQFVTFHQIEFYRIQSSKQKSHIFRLIDKQTNFNSKMSCSFSAF